MAAIASFAGAGCATVDGAAEPLRVGTVADLTPDGLGVIQGETSLDDARAALRRRGLTGIVDDTLADGSGPTLSVLAADYQSRVLVFRDGRLAGALALPTRGLPPYDLALHLAAHGEAPALLVAYRDPLDRADQPPTMLLFDVRRGDGAPTFRLGARATLAGLADKHAGLSEPLFVGNDLHDGVMFVAKAREGALWDTSYLVTTGPSGLAFSPHPMSEALMCSCVQRYAASGPKR